MSAMFDFTGQRLTDTPEAWAPFLVAKEDIDEAIVRLCDGAAAEDGYRSAGVVHPRSAGDMPSLTPGTDVTVNVLKPGESTTVLRRNVSQLEICIGGSGVVAADRSFSVGKWDVWTNAPMEPVRYHNPGNEVWVRLTYSNAPLMRKLGSYFCEEGDQIGESEGTTNLVEQEKAKIYNMDNAPDLPIGTDGARLRGYEFLTDIAVKANPSLLWRWDEVYPYLPKRVGDNNRTIWLLYNPATEKKQGTSHSFFATWAGAAAGTKPYAGARGHRHNSASINYHALGSGKSVVDGHPIAWKSGDLLFSAPAWREHAHYYGQDDTAILTVQDHPTLIGLGSLLWQEDVTGRIFVLGAHEGQKGWTGPRERGA